MNSSELLRYKQTIFLNKKNTCNTDLCSQYNDVCDPILDSAIVEYTGMLAGVAYVQGPQGPPGPPGASGTNTIETALLKQPPAPTNPVVTATSASISISWTNPVQKQLGIMPILVPYIKYINITITNNNGLNINGGGVYPTNPSYTILENSEIVTPLITGINILYADGTSHFDLVDKKYVWYINDTVLTDKFKLSFWFSNYSTEPVDKLDILDISFAPGGAPSMPSITYTKGESYSGTVSVTPGQYTDASNQTNIPLIEKYSISYLPVSTKKKNIVLSTTPNTIDSSNNQIYITGLLPATTYNITATVTSSLNLTSIPSNNIEAITDLPPLGGFIDSLALGTIFKSGYSVKDIYYNGAKINYPVIEYGKLWSTNIPNIFITNDPLSVNSSIEVNISGNGIISTKSSIQFDDTNNTIQLGAYGTLQNDSQNNGIIIRTISAISEPYTGNQSGFYLQSNFGIDVESNKYNASSNAYTLQIKQIIESIEGTTLPPSIYQNSLAFYIDDINSNLDITIHNFDILNNSDIVYSCGVPISPDTWSLSIKNITISNIIRYFHVSDILSYMFANTSSFTPILSAYNVINPYNTILFYPNGYTIQSLNTTNNLYMNPTFTLLAKNIAGKSAITTKQVNMIIDKITYNTIKNMNMEPFADGITTGLRMKTSIKRFDETIEINSVNRDDMLYEFAEYRQLFDNSLSIIGTKEIQFIGGRYLTPSYTGIESSIAYKDYGNGLDYSSIDSSGYKWATFRWRIANGTMNNIQFAMNDISGASTISSVYNNIIVGSKPIHLYYRIENSSYNSGNPENILNTQFYGDNASGKAVSSVWINATSKNNVDSFGKLCGYLPYSGILGGNITTNINNTSINITVESPTIFLNTETIYVYLLCGLPVDSDISFKNITCKSIF